VRLVPLVRFRGPPEKAVSRPAQQRQPLTPTQTTTPALAGTSQREAPSFEPGQPVATPRCIGSIQKHPNSAEVVRSLVSAGKKMSITGELKYQACDTAICYPPNQCL
jgi:hypothetical protein